MTTPRITKRLLKTLPLVWMLTTLTANGGCDYMLEPLIDLDIGYLSTDPQIPWAADPFRRVAGFVEVKPIEEKFVLGGIVYDRNEPMAIVNGESVLVGDELDGRVVDSIGRNYVIMRKGDSLKEVVLPPEEDQ